MLYVGCRSKISNTEGSPDYSEAPSKPPRTAKQTSPPSEQTSKPAPPKVPWWSLMCGDLMDVWSLMCDDVMCSTSVPAGGGTGVC